MALFLPSPLVGAISGKVGGCTFVAGGRGRRVQGPASCPRRRSLAQTMARSRMHWARRAWGQLTDAQRTSWRLAAAGYGRTDRLGQERAYTGFELFVLVNLGQYGWAGTVVTSPPAVVFGASPRLIQWRAATDGYMTVRVQLPGVSYPWRFRAWAATQSESVFRGRCRNFRLLGEMSGSSEYLAWAAYWLAAFGAVPGTNQRITMRLENLTGCYSSAPLYVHFRSDGSWYYA
jgi:hypothetical protein